MKRVLVVSLFSVFLLVIGQNYAQNVKVDIQVNADTVWTNKYKIRMGEPDVIYLRMAYGSHSFLNTSALRRLQSKEIESIRLIYTEYPEGADLEWLTKRRLISLYLLEPKIYEQSAAWKFIAQTGATSASNAARMFHGFEITMRPEKAKDSPTIAGAGDETTYLREVVEGKRALEDSTVIRVLGRNPDWEEMLVVADLTGSMSPYIAQLLVWLKLNMHERPAQHFVFFNDGDRTPNFLKQIGETGGLYDTKTESLDTVLHTAYKTMMNGYGGDEPENNVEATLHGINECQHCQDVVMIADNWATPRDLSLAKKVKKPLKIILCGTDKGVNAKYLNLARQTGGSIHTIEEDILNLMDLNEGESIVIGDEKFQIQSGEFTQVLE